LPSKKAKRHFVPPFFDLESEVKSFVGNSALYKKNEKKYFMNLAQIIKEGFDTRFPGTWHVIVGLELRM
jgi:hypothetical protein